MYGIMKCIDELGLYIKFDRPLLWTLCAWVIAQIFIRKCKWCKASKVPYYIVNAFIMFLALLTCSIDMPVGVQIIAALASIAAFSINLKDLFDITPLAGAYIGFKYSVLALALLRMFSMPSQVNSIALLIIAALCIAFGFKMNNKSVRLYGLIVSIISVAKLILVDISYDNSLMRAFSFLICGLICFAISIAYNRMERKMKESKVISNEEVYDERREKSEGEGEF